MASPGRRSAAGEWRVPDGWAAFIIVTVLSEDRSVVVSDEDAMEYIAALFQRLVSV
jgi:hypothetical protein